MKSCWTCGLCGAEGEVECAEAAALETWLDLIRRDHQLINPECEFDQHRVLIWGEP